MVVMAKSRGRKTWNQNAANFWITSAILQAAFYLSLLSGSGFIVPAKELFAPSLLPRTNYFSRSVGVKSASRRPRCIPDIEGWLNSPA